MRARGLAALLIGVMVLSAAARVAGAERPVTAADYSPSDLRTLRSLWIGSLGPPPDDPSNAYDTDPRAALLGRRIFFDTRFSANGKLACVSCHDPNRSFQDGKPVAEGVSKLARRSMTLLGVAHNTWFFWDGRKDSLWSQAITPIENPLELGLSREQVAAFVARYHRADYEAIFGPLSSPEPGAPARVLVNVAKSIAAFVRTIQPEPARFDRYAEAVLAGRGKEAGAILNGAETRGLRLFIGKAKCINCHAGPLFTNHEFHFTRVPQRTPDAGRSEGIAKVQHDEFNCTSPYSDAAADACSALRFIDPDTRESMRAFKTPTLRNVAVRAPYMNAGQFRTLAEVLHHYRDATRGLKEIGHGDLSDAELRDLEAFLRTLTGGVH